MRTLFPILFYAEIFPCIPNRLPRDGEVFFAPTHYSQRSEEWGAAILQQRIDEAWIQFNQNLTNWLEVIEQSGQPAILKVYEETLLGKAEPSKGNILRF